MSTLSIERIIVRMPNWLGDLVMATPILTDLRRHWPSATIVAMCQGALGTAIAKDPHIDGILSFKKPKRPFGEQAFKEVIQPLRDGRFDLGILLTHSFSSAYWFWRGQVKKRIGYAAHCRKFLLNQPLPFEQRTQHLVLTYKGLLEPLGIPLSQTPPTLFLSAEERLSAKARALALGLDLSSDLVIGVNPGAAYGSAKCWLPDRFKELNRRLIAQSNIKLIYFADEAGTALVNEICSGFPKDRVLNLAGQTKLRELFALIECCHLFLTNDSGPMHVASALNVPLVALFGSTSDLTTGPYRGGTVIHKRVACSPCYRRVCPIDFRCMTQISVDEVCEVIIHQLLAVVTKTKRGCKRAEVLPPAP